MDCFEFCPWEGVKHVGHPLPLDGFDRMVHSRPAGFERFPTELVPQPRKNWHNFLLWDTPKRNILEIAIDVCASDEGMMIALDDEVKLDMLVLLHEAFEGGRDQSVADSSRAASEVAEVEGKFTQLKYSSSAHSIIIIITINIIRLLILSPTGVGTCALVTCLEEFASALGLGRLESCRSGSA